MREEHIEHQDLSPFVVEALQASRGFSGFIADYTSEHELPPEALNDPNNPHYQRIQRTLALLLEEGVIRGMSEPFSLEMFSGVDSRTYSDFEAFRLNGGDTGLLGERFATKRYYELVPESQRVRKLRSNPPTDEWDGIHTIYSK